MRDFRQQFLNAENVTDSEFVVLDRNRQPLLLENGNPITVRVHKEGDTIFFNVAGRDVPYVHFLTAVRDIKPGARYVREKGEEQEQTPEIQDIKTLNEFHREFLLTENLPGTSFTLLDRSHQPVVKDGWPVTVNVARKEGTIMFHIAGTEIPYVDLLPVVREIAPTAAFVTPERVAEVETEDSLMTLYDAERQVKDLLGNIPRREWETIENAFADLRSEIDRMQWFEMGPNSVGAEKEGQRWSQLVLAPRNSEHRRELLEILADLQIHPWSEVQNNVPVLVIENPRDIALLSAGFIFDYLANTADRIGRRRALEELWERQRGEALSAHQIYERQRAEQQRVVQMDLDAEEFRKRSRAEREQRIALTMNSIAHIINRQEPIEVPAALPSDQYHQFGYPRRGRIPQPVVSGPRERAELTPEEIEPFSLDVDVEKIEEDFRTGKVNEDTLQEELTRSEPLQRQSQRRTPDLKLFPKKYEWIPPERKGLPGSYRERATGRILTDADIEQLIDQIQKDDIDEKHAAVRELSLIERQLILYAIRSLKEVYPAADPDDLFQGALMGLTYAAEHYEKRPDGKFISYLMPNMEGVMRQMLRGEFYPVHTPDSFSSQRNKIRDAERGLRAQNPDKRVEAQKIQKVLHDQGVIPEDTSQAYDRYVRRVLWEFEQIDPAVFEQEEFQPHDISMLGDSLAAEARQLNENEGSELQQNMSQILSTLSPREERVVRKYFELDVRPGQPSMRLYEELASEFSMDAEAVKKKIHDLTALGDLTDRRTLEKLSQTDRDFVEKYLENLGGIRDATLESIAQEYDVSGQRIRQIIEKALRRMKHPSRSRVLGQYLSE